VTSREGYTCIVNLTEYGTACSCKLSQLQKLPYAHVIAACTWRNIVPT